MKDEEFLNNATPSMIGRITDYLFFDNKKTLEGLDAVILLGSRTCAYRVEQAFELLKDQKDIIWIVSGGGICGEPPLYEGAPEMTEAEYMKEVLLRKGVEESHVLLENKSRYTGENISYSLSLIVSDKTLFPVDRELRIGIATGGFHMKRVFVGLTAAIESGRYDFVTIPTYGGLTKRESWYKTLAGVRIIHGELDRIGRDDLMEKDAYSFSPGNEIGEAVYSVNGQKLSIRYGENGEWVAFPAE